MADVNWDAPSVMSYAAGDPKGGTNFFAPLTDALKPTRQQTQQPGQPLNISPQGPGGPSWFDRLRGFLAGTNPPTPGVVNPNPPSPTDMGGGPDPGSIDDFASRFYYTPRQAGGPVGPPALQGGAGQGMPGYAGRLMNVAGSAPMSVQAPMLPGGMPPGAPMPAAIPPGMPPGAPGMPPGAPNMGAPMPGTPMPGAPAGGFPMAQNLMNRFGGNVPPGYTGGGLPWG